MAPLFQERLLKHLFICYKRTALLSIMDYTSFALEKLKEAGLKLTNPRKMLVEFLAKSDKVLSPYEMKALLKKEKINADVVTIYRVLEVLESMELVHKVQAFNGYIRCNIKKN